MLKKGFRIFLLLGLIAAAAGGYWLWRGYRDVFAVRQVAPSQRLFTIPEGTGLNFLLARLNQMGLAPEPLFPRLALYLDGQHLLIKKGTYQLPEQASTWELLRLFHEGQVRLLKVTIPEGLDKWEMAALLGKTPWGEESEFAALIGDPTAIAALDPEARDLEGYLFPETYFFEEQATPQEIVNAMVSQFIEATAGLRERLEEARMTQTQWLTLASLVEEESAVPEERTIIAGVFRNRLERGMLLQCDPTIIYSLKLEGQYRGRIYKSQILFDSLYNTYVYAGLPPGPIASPGRAALAAALDPSEHNFLFFVARNDGTHHFSESLREHNRAVAKYQR